MTDPRTPDAAPAGSCERIGLLLSLSADGAATTSQLAELDAHLPRCPTCRRAAAADAAVRRRIVELSAASAPAPAWLDGFAARTTARAVALAREARAQNRLLVVSAAAALLVAVTAQFAWPGRDAAPAPSDGGSSGETAALREAARSAVMRPPRLVEGK